MRLDEHNVMHIIKLTNLQSIYSHLRISVWIPEFKKWFNKCFIDEWNKDKKQRYYSAFDFCPPPYKCPSHVYNAWQGYPIEEEPLDEDADTSRIYQHIRHISNHSEAAYEYILNWYAHIIQYPGRKINVCILLHGKTGTGKSVIAERLLKLIIGMDKIRITCKPDKVFGRFADLQGKLLVVLDEASGKDTFAIHESIKDAITATHISMEKKGIDSVDILDFTNYMFTTNNLNAMCIDSDDRRFFVLSVDGSIKNNKEYFVLLYADLANIKVVRKFYAECKARDLSKWDPINDRPITAFAQDMHEMNRDPIDAFKEYMCSFVLPDTNESNIHPGKVEFTASALYAHFRQFWQEDGRKADHLMTGTKFGIVIKSKDWVTFKAGTRQRLYLVDKDLCVQHSDPEPSQKLTIVVKKK